MRAACFEIKGNGRSDPGPFLSKAAPVPPANSPAGQDGSTALCGKFNPCDIVLYTQRSRLAKSRTILVLEHRA